MSASSCQTIPLAAETGPVDEGGGDLYTSEAKGKPSAGFAGGADEAVSTLEVDEAPNVDGIAGDEGTEKDLDAAGEDETEVEGVNLSSLDGVDGKDNDDVDDDEMDRWWPSRNSSGTASRACLASSDRANDSTTVPVAGTNAWCTTSPKSSKTAKIRAMSSLCMRSRVSQTNTSTQAHYLYSRAGTPRIFSVLIRATHYCVLKWPQSNGKVRAPQPAL